MTEKKQPLKWYVYRENFNSKHIEPFNVFEHGSFLEDTEENYKKNKNNFDVFSEQLQRDARYYFRSKCEWEILIKNWLTRDDIKARKVDVREQIMINYDHFLDYVWNNRSELLKQYPPPIKNFGGDIMEVDLAKNTKLDFSWLIVPMNIQSILDAQTNRKED